VDGREPSGAYFRHPDGVPVLTEPLSSADRRALRTAVLALARSTRARRIPPSVHIGVPGGPTITMDVDPAWDHGLRTEMVGAALRAQADPPWVWVTRSGPLAFQDVDAAWLGSTVAASAEREVDLAFVVVTRGGWIDPRSGLRREWKRIRSR
jgi:hypothetical protein